MPSSHDPSGGAMPDDPRQWPVLRDEQARIRERNAIIAIGVIVLALTNLPYIWGVTIHPEGQVFSGFVYTWTFYDSLSYLAKMRDGFDGSFFYSNPFTTESIKPVFLFVFYILLGHIAHLLHLSLVAAYHLARVVSGVFLMFAVDRFIRLLGMRGNSRILGFALTFLGGGFGWLLYWTRTGGVPTEFMQTEGFCFQSMVSYPHFALALSLMVWMLADAFKFGRGERGGGLLGSSALASFTLGWVHPRPLLTIVCVCALAAAWGAVRHLWPLKRWLVFILVVLLSAAAPTIVSLLTVRGDPLWTAWSKTETLSEPFWKYLLAYGLLWPLSLAGARKALQEEEPWAPILIAWLIAGTLLPYLPIAAQGRLIIGWNIPLALLSGYALADMILPAMQRRSRGLAAATPFILCVLVFVMSLSAVAYLGVGVGRVLKGAFPGYYSRDRADALAWLHDNTSADDVVLSSVLSGMFIPAYAGNRVVQGHWAETFDPDRKADEVSEIFTASTPSQRRIEFLDRFHVRYLLYGQWERELGDYNPKSDPNLWVPRWRGLATTIYERSAAPR